MGKKRKAIIMAGGPINQELALKELALGYDLLIAADSGGEFLYRHGYIPTILLGDFDSISSETLLALETQGAEIITYPAEKDYTDLELAVETSILRGAEEIAIYGGLGGRLDHTLGNLGLMRKAHKKGVKMVLTGLRERVFLLSPGQAVILPSTEEGFFSVLPLSEKVEGLTIEGAKYPLSEIKLEYGSTLGIHNEFVGAPVRISVTVGYLYILLALADNNL